MENESHTVKIIEVEPLTHNVKRFKIQKPHGYVFKEGQATELSINKDGWQDKKRPFTFTSLNDWDNLEFTIKIYKDHKGVTNELDSLAAGDEVILHDVWGTILYDGPGVFIAGGAGITPFIAILRDLEANHKIEGNKLIFANQTDKDIILQNEMEGILGDQFINILSEGDNKNFAHGYINKAFLENYLQNKEQKVYLCGPEPMMDAVAAILKEMNIKDENIITEKF